MFKVCQTIAPQKFQYKKAEAENDEALFKQELLKKPLFKDNPALVEFARKTKGTEENIQSAIIDMDEDKRNVQEESKLVWGRPFFGIYDRYGSRASNLENDWATAGPGHDAGCPAVGGYFVTDEPLRV